MVGKVKKEGEVSLEYMKIFEREEMLIEQGIKQDRREEKANTEREKQRADASLVIRKAETADYEEVKLLEELLFGIHRQERPDYFKKVEDSYSRKEFEELLASPSAITWVAVYNGCIVGICFGKITETKESQICKSRKIAFIEDLVTLREYRGNGIATALIARAREQAAAEGAEALELCVWNFSTEALRLYERLGMKVQYYRMEGKL